RPTAANPQPATSSYLNAPIPIKSNPTKIIIVVAQARTVFLFIDIIQILFSVYLQTRHQGFSEIYINCFIAIQKSISKQIRKNVVRIPRHYVNYKYRIFKQKSTQNRCFLYILK